MTFDTREKSVHSGAPVEVYRFMHTLEWLLTSADVVVPLTIDGTPMEFEPLAIERTAPEHTREQLSGSLSVTIPRDHAIAQLFVFVGPTKLVTLDVWKAHDGDGEPKPVFRGEVLSASFDGGRCTLRCSPYSHAMKRKIPRITFQRQCPLVLGGAGCGVNLNPFKTVATALATVNGSVITASHFDDFPDGFFDHGYVERIADGRRAYVRTHVGTTITLAWPIRGLVAGDQVYAFAGDDRTEETCKNKFNNLINHQGRPRIPRRNDFEAGLGI